MTMIHFLLVFAAACASPSDGGLKVLRQSHAGTTRDVALVGRADQNQIVQRVMTELGRPSVTIGRVLVFPSEAASRMLFRENQTSCKSEGLLSFLKENGLATDPPRCPEVSEAIKIGPEIVLRSINADCQTSTRMLQGKPDPLSITASGVSADIVDLWVGVAPKSQETWGREFPGIAVFVKTLARLTPNVGKDILRQMQQVSGARDIFVALRNDSDFGKYCQFPQPFLFGSPRSAHHRAEPNGGALLCVSVYPHPVQCWREQGAAP